MIELLKQPWPWYIAGPLIGLVVPMLLVIGGKQFGVSANLRHTCAACMPAKIESFQYVWKKAGACPGPLFTLAGAGYGIILVPIASAVLGTWVYGALRPKLPH